MDPSLFYTGLVAELYDELRSESFDPEPYARFVARSGEPALELGCGDSGPFLDLVGQGLEVEGVDSSPDMVRRCLEAARSRGLDVVVHLQAMESMKLGRRYRSIYLAGPTFNLLPDDDKALGALRAIRAHLEDGGSAMIPLFIPGPTPASELGRFRQAPGPGNSTLRFAPIAEERDETARSQTTLLRYERVDGQKTTSVERPWVLHWHSQRGFEDLAAAAGLATRSVRSAGGAPAEEDSDAFVFFLNRAR